MKKKDYAALSFLISTFVVIFLMGISHQLSLELYIAALFVTLIAIAQISSPYFVKPSYVKKQNYLALVLFLAFLAIMFLKIFRS